MSVSKYEIFLKVVELGSVTRAAEQLDYTQSGVSHAISGMEEEFGFPLLIRRRSGVQLTPDGEQVLPAIQNIVNSREQLHQIVSAIHGLNAGTVLATLTLLELKGLVTGLPGRRVCRNDGR